MRWLYFGVINLYTGFDPREEAGYHVFVSSVIERCSMAVAVMPLHGPWFRDAYKAGDRDGTNAFTYTRFLIPYLQQWRGWALFCDGADMLCRADMAELWEQKDWYKAVQVVKHDYKTNHPRKYIGTAMESDNRDYPRKNWSSVMLINCAHYQWRAMRPERVERMSGAELHGFAWITDNMIGELPVEWNWLADEYGENEGAKLTHWTAGSPGFPHYADAPHANEFRAQLRQVNHLTN